jgi:hypothetical protein
MELASVVKQRTENNKHAGADVLVCDEERLDTLQVDHLPVWHR